MARLQLEQEAVDVSHRLYRAGWVANHDGNVTVRLGEARFLATPTGISKAALGRSDLIIVDDAGKLQSGRNKPFSELELHLHVYRHRPDVNAVVHAHPPTATGFAVAGVPVLTTMLAEPVVSLGASVPLVPYGRPQSPEATLNLTPYLEDAEVLMLENHGVLSYGSDLTTALLRMELIEHLAKIQAAAQAAGGVRQIPESDVQLLLEARTRVGLGKAGREAKAVG